MQQTSKVERRQPHVVDYSAARAKALEWLGDRYLLAKPINRKTSPPPTVPLSTPARWDSCRRDELPAGLLTTFGL